MFTSLVPVIRNLEKNQIKMTNNLNFFKIVFLSLVKKSYVGIKKKIFISFSLQYAKRISK